MLTVFWCDQKVGQQLDKKYGGGGDVLWLQAGNIGRLEVGEEGLGGIGSSHGMPGRGKGDTGVAGKSGIELKKSTFKRKKKRGSGRVDGMWWFFKKSEGQGEGWGLEKVISY